MGAQTILEILENLNMTALHGTRLSYGDRILFGQQLTEYIQTAGLKRSSLPEGEMTLFTGEKVRTRFAVWAITMAEAARGLVVLGLSDYAAREARAKVALQLGDTCFAHECMVGECAHSTLAWMRYLNVSGLPSATPNLKCHLASIYERRNGNGQWQGLPYYYALLVLSEIELPEAQNELNYALSYTPHLIKRSWAVDPVAQRRKLLLEHILAPSWVPSGVPVVVS